MGERPDPGPERAQLETSLLARLDAMNDGEWGRSLTVANIVALRLDGATIEVVRELAVGAEGDLVFSLATRRLRAHFVVRQVLDADELRYAIDFVGLDQEVAGTIIRYIQERLRAS